MITATTTIATTTPTMAGTDKPGGLESVSPRPIQTTFPSQSHQQNGKTEGS